MWGIVVGILGAAVSLSVAQTLFEQDPKKADIGKPAGQLTEPDKDFKASPDGKSTAPMCREADAKNALNKARRFGSKLK